MNQDDQTEQKESSTISGGPAPKPKLSRIKSILFSVLANLAILILIALSAEFYLSRTAAKFDIAVIQAKYPRIQDRAGKVEAGRNPDTKIPHSIIYDQYGLYDSTTLRQPPAKDVFRIALFGDSFVENLGLSWDEGLAAQLEKCLRRDGFNIEVINAGFSGIGSVRELELMHELLPQLHPNLALLNWFNNDLLENLNEQYSKSPPKINFLARSYLYNFFNYKINNLEYETFKSLYSIFFIHGEMEKNTKIELDITKQVFDQMQKLSSRYQCRFGVVTVPNAISFSEITTKEAYADICARTGKKLKDFRPGQPYYFIAKIAMDQNIPVYPFLFNDFKRILSQVPPQTMEARQLLFFASDPHWNEKGCAFAAEAICVWLQTNNLLINESAKAD